MSRLLSWGALPVDPTPVLCPAGATVAGAHGAAAAVVSDGAEAPVAIRLTTPGRRIFSHRVSIPLLSLTLVSA
jgi:hypothetical protein